MYKINILFSDSQSQKSVLLSHYTFVFDKRSVAFGFPVLDHGNISIRTKIFTSLQDSDLQYIKFRSVEETKNRLSITYRKSLPPTIPSKVEVLQIKQLEDKLIDVKHLADVSNPTEYSNLHSEAVGVFTLSELSQKMKEIHTTCKALLFFV